MKLTRKQRAQFFARDWPLLAGKGKPPCEPGYVHHLSTRLWFTVTNVRLTRGGWRLVYKVYDDREEPFHLMPTAASFPTNERGQMVDDLPPEEEIGYTRNPKRRTIDPLRSVPPNVQNVIRMRARLQHAQRYQSEKAEQAARDDVRRFAARVRDVTVRAARMGVDTVPIIARLERELREAEGELEDAA